MFLLNSKSLAFTSTHQNPYEISTPSSFFKFDRRDPNS